MINLKRIGWEDGTLVSKAKVEVSGQIYDVEPEEYTGTTPVSSANLKKMEDNTEEAINEAIEGAFINAYLETNQEISRGDNFKIKLGKAETVGKYFELDKNNYNIKVLKDCIALINAMVFVDKAAGEGYVFLKINVNEKTVNSNLVRIINRDYVSVVTRAKPIALKEGDIINLKVDYTSDSGNPQLRSTESTTGLMLIKI